MVLSWDMWQGRDALSQVDWKSSGYPLSTTKLSSVDTTLFCIISTSNLQKMNLVPYQKFLTYHSRTSENPGALSPQHFRLPSDDPSCCSSIEYFSAQTSLVAITRSKTLTALSLTPSFTPFQSTVFWSYQSTWSRWRYVYLMLIYIEALLATWDMGQDAQILKF